MSSPLVIFAFVTMATAHYTFHDWSAMPAVTNRFLSEHRRCDNMPELFSYHVHILFWSRNAAHIAGAMKIKNMFMDKFRLSKNCTMAPGDPASNEEMCVFEDKSEPFGPFLTGQIAFFIPRHWYLETVRFVLQNRGSYDVLVHPNSGCETNDHQQWALWAGNKWELDAAFLMCDYPGCVPKS